MTRRRAGVCLVGDSSRKQIERRENDLSESHFRNDHTEQYDIDNAEFVFRIIDLDLAEDRIDIRDPVFSNCDAILAATSDEAGGARIVLNEDSTVLLENVLKADLDAELFGF